MLESCGGDEELMKERCLEILHERAENPPPAADEATSQESSRFMQLIVDESLEAPLEVLAEKVDGLSEGALQILAGITSAPTTDDFKGAIKGMTIELLMKLRKRFRGMGF